MTPRGRARKHNHTIPDHIDQSGIPKGVYWDSTGKGRWFVFVEKEGKPARETIAGPHARLSDLHTVMEQGRGGSARGSIAWMLEQFHASSKFKELSAGSQTNMKVYKKAIVEFPTKLGIPFGALMADRLTQTNIQRLHEAVVKQGHPTKANHLLRYLRRVYKWAGPHLGIKFNPARGIEQARERKKRVLPEHQAYEALLAFAKERGALQAHSKGSVPPYLWIVYQLGYLCRLRGIEANTLTEANAEKEGLRTNRRKRSKDNIVEWNDSLRAAWDAALAYRKSVVERLGLPVPLRPQDRYVILSEDGQLLTKSGLDSAWQRFIKMAIKEGVITEAQRFSLHSLKRKGVTDTKGTKHDKQDAAGLTEPMMQVYDHSLAVVKPSDA
jgi:hypothetical protein